MHTSVGLTLSGRHLTITSADAFAGLILAFDEASGNGAYINCDVRPGDTLVPLPLTGERLTFELVDSASGAMVAAL